MDIDRNKENKQRPRRLLLCLDGVPHSLILQARERGLFQNFHAPARLLSPFPTLTNVALAAMLGATPPPGYESLYFNKQAWELQGGIRKYLGRRTAEKFPSSYMAQLDYQEPLAFEFLVYVAPERVWRADMNRFRESFRAAPKTRDYFAFLKGTDGLLHISGPENLQRALRSLDKILNEIHEWCGAETETVLFSDHGMNLCGNQRVHLKTYLARRGFTFDRGRNGKRKFQIATPAFGLCGYSALYCHDPEMIPVLAEGLAELEGVDFALYRDGLNAVIVESPRGRARIERQTTDGEIKYCYLPLTGDPLNLQSKILPLRQQGKIDGAGYARDDIWLAATAEDKYPDALANLFSSLQRERVQHTADVLISFADGYYYGWSPFGKIVNLAATHGNALRPSTDAFLMSTHQRFPAYVRADSVQPLLARDVA